VLATQNPIEQEGTYPLPEAQLDRFLFDVRVGYPSAEDEVACCARPPGRRRWPLEPVLDASRRSPCSAGAARGGRAEHILALRDGGWSRATRPDDRRAPPGQTGGARPGSWGAGRATARRWISGAKAHALLDGRFAVTPDDVPAGGGAGAPAPRAAHVRRRADGVDADRIVAGGDRGVAAPASGLRV
jgi:MoxR-like ATPase